MNFQDQREAAIRLEVWRQGDPGFDFKTVMTGGDLDLFNRGHVQIRKNVRVEVRQDTVVAAV